MLFNSLAFLAFAVIFFLIWQVIKNYRQPRFVFLIIASFIFYGWWDARFILLIMFSGLIDYLAGLAIEKYTSRKRFFLVLSICGNIGSLALFKYLGFFTSNLKVLSEALGLGLDIPVLRLALPIGISFYTFQSMSYTIDIFRGNLKPTKNIFHFFAYLSLFPQLVAGPIIRASHLLPQLNKTRNPTEKQQWEGIKLIVYGFFKKVVVADHLGLIVDLAFRDPHPIQSAPYWWIIITFFAIQIYCDFAGYSDIARGIGKLMGYDFPLNFDHPYISRSFQEFWTRWHISLSTWFRDYVFYPIFQRKITVANAHIAMWITMLLSGFWHGAHWNFLIWGGLHAFYYSVEQITRLPKRLSKIKGGRLLSTIIVLILLWISWIFFRASSLNQAMEIMGIMLNPFNTADFEIERFTIIIGIILFVAILREILAYIGFDKMIKQYKYYEILETVLVAFALVGSVFLRGTGQVFIYFQF